MTNRQVSNYQLFTGLLSSLITITGRAVGTCCVQAMQGVIPNFQLSAIRALVQGPLYILVGAIKRKNFIIEKVYIFPTICLALLYVVKNVGYFGSAKYLPLVEVVGISSMFTMLSAVVHARLAYQREIMKVDLMSMCICMLGILLIIQPSLVFKVGTSYNSSLKETVHNTTCLYDTKNGFCVSMEQTPFYESSSQTGYLLVIFGGLAQGITYNLNGFPLSNVQPLVKSAYFVNLYFFLSVMFSLYLEQMVFHVSSEHVLYLIGYCGVSVFSTYANIYSVHQIGGTRASLIHSFETLAILGAQYTFMKAFIPGHRNWMEVGGAVAMIAGIALSPLNDIIQNSRQSNILP